MKITEVKTFVCNAFRTNFVFVKIETDSGLYGWGEATLEYKENTVVAAIHDLERYLVGSDPQNIGAFIHDCYRDAYWRGGPVLMSALAGVEIALWDIKGKALGVPVYQLLGGKVRDSIPIYVNGWFAPAKTPDEFAEKAKSVRDRKFWGCKWDPFGKSWQQISKKDFATAMECVSRVAETVGKDVQLLIEGHGRFDIPTAVKIGKALEDFDIYWFEEPIPPDDLNGLREVKERVRVSLAAGERLYNRYEYRKFFDLNCTDYIQPDISHAGGILEMRFLGAESEARHIGFCPHNPSGPVANAATLQLAACIPNFIVLEMMDADVPWRADICDEQLVMRDGRMVIPDRPGIGIDLDEKELLKHPYIETSLRHYRGDLTNVRTADAVPYYTMEFTRNEGK
ncbi:MAG: galactonate dehydratase [Lentisphaeria bacterium]|nr:galactonate dehydratase [Lentisphaeria bacterium]